MPQLNKSCYIDNVPKNNFRTFNWKFSRKKNNFLMTRNKQTL